MCVCGLEMCIVPSQLGPVILCEHRPVSYSVVVSGLFGPFSSSSLPPHQVTRWDRTARTTFRCPPDTLFPRGVCLCVYEGLHLNTPHGFTQYRVQRPVCHEACFQILFFLNGCSYYCYCCHIGEFCFHKRELKLYLFF